MKVLSSIPGRVRLQHELLYRNDNLSQLVNFYLRSQVGIQMCTVNPVIGTLVIVYDPEKVNIKIIQDKTEKILNSKHQFIEYIDAYNQEFFAEEAQLHMAKQRMVFFGTLYLLVKLKSLIFGKFAFGHSLPMLKVAAVITIATGYPSVRKRLEVIEKYFPTTADRVLLVTGTTLTLLREGSKGILLLFFKALTDSFQISSNLQRKNFFLQSTPNPLALVWRKVGTEEELVPVQALKPDDEILLSTRDLVLIDGTVVAGEGEANCMYWSGQQEIRHLRPGETVASGMAIISGEVLVRVEQVPELWPETDFFPDNLAIWQQASRYEVNVLYLAAGMALLGYFVTGNTIAPLAVLLVMNPAAAKLAVSSGLTNYLRLLMREKIIVHNPRAMEKVPAMRTIVFDKTGTLTEPQLLSTDEGTKIEERLGGSVVSGLEKLRDRGLKFVIVSGDVAENVATVAEELQITEYYANCSPEEKARIVQQKQAAGPVMMVGDGINDIPAMKAADMSVTFGDACSHTLIQADCILQEKNLELIATLLELTETSYQRMEQNLHYAQYYNLGYGVLGLLGWVDLFQAESLNVLNAIFALINSGAIGKWDVSTLQGLFSPLENWQNFQPPTNTSARQDYSKTNREWMDLFLSGGSRPMSLLGK